MTHIYPPNTNSITYLLTYLLTYRSIEAAWYRGLWLFTLGLDSDKAIQHRDTVK